MKCPCCLPRMRRKRKGFLLYELVLSMALMAGLTVSFCPFFEKALLAMEWASLRARLTEESMLVSDFMAEKFRNTGKTAQKSGPRSSIYYNEPNGTTAPLTYRFFGEDKKIKILLYTGTVQPLTGNTPGSRNQLTVSQLLFNQHPEGLIQFSFTMSQEKKGETMDIQGAVLPYVYFYHAGES